MGRVPRPGSQASRHGAIREHSGAIIDQQAILPVEDQRVVEVPVVIDVRSHAADAEVVRFEAGSPAEPSTQVSPSERSCDAPDDGRCTSFPGHRH